MNENRNKETLRKAHPGWSIQFEDGTWLGGAHGWFRDEDAFYADIYESEARALEILEYVKKDHSYDSYFQLAAKVVPAWEPLCEHLRHENKSLKAANKISPSDLFDLSFELDMVLSKLKELGSKE